MQKINQSEKIYAHLKSGRSLTPLAALKLFGCFRLAARIFDIKKKHGVRIVNVGEERGGKVYARYLLKK